jgi:hypothetical protein
MTRLPLPATQTVVEKVKEVKGGCNLSGIKKKNKKKYLVQTGLVLCGGFLIGEGAAHEWKESHKETGLAHLTGSQTATLCSGDGMVLEQTGRREGEDVEYRTDWAIIPTQTRTESPDAPSGSKRTGLSLVTSIMALLATFQDAGVLPPEGTREADRVIHAVIQLQSALLKSPSPDLNQFLIAALQAWNPQGWEIFHQEMTHQGLSTEILEALVMYPANPPMWERHSVAQALMQFNVTEKDWKLLEGLFRRANAVYAEREVSIHEAFAHWRMSML